MFCEKDKTTSIKAANPQPNYFVFPHSENPKSANTKVPSRLAPRTDEFFAFWRNKVASLHLPTVVSSPKAQVDPLQKSPPRHSYCKAFLAMKKTANILLTLRARSLGFSSPAKLVPRNRKISCDNGMIRAVNPHRVRREASSEAHE